MSSKRRQYSAEYKFKVALEAAKGTKTLAEQSSDTGVHANQISQWKAQLLDEGASLFHRNGDKSLREFQQQEAELYEQIGRLKMDGRGRALDNVFVERLWRSLKYENIYIQDYGSVPELAPGLAAYFWFYNTERPYQSLGYLTPAAVHFA